MYKTAHIKNRSDYRRIGGLDNVVGNHLYFVSYLVMMMTKNNKINKKILVQNFHSKFVTIITSSNVFQIHISEIIK